MKRAAAMMFALAWGAPALAQNVGAEENASSPPPACAKAPIPVRDGTPLTVTKEVASVLFRQLIYSAGKQLEKNPKPERLKIWCAEGLVADTSVPMLLWHSVFEDGTDALSDRVTLATNEEQAPLISASDTLENTIPHAGAKDAPPTQPRWIATLQDDKQTSQFTIFDGRPSGNVLAALLSNIIAGKAQPIGGYRINEKHITFHAPSAS